MSETSIQRWPSAQLCRYSCDRYIPVRWKLNFDGAYKHLMGGYSSPTTAASTSSLADYSCLIRCRGDNPEEVTDIETYRTYLRVAMNQKSLERVLSFSSSSSKESSRSETSNAVWHIRNKNCKPSFRSDAPVKKECGKVLCDPDKVLAITDFRNDFYCNTMDWGKDNVMAVVLKDSTVLWNCSTNTTATLSQTCTFCMEHFQRWEPDEPFASSVKWNHSGQCLAMGSSQGIIELWDAARGQSVSKASQISNLQIGCIEWHDSEVYTGSRDGHIRIMDSRLPLDQHATIRVGRRFEVTSLQLSPNGTVLACGSDDGYIRLWCTRTWSLLLSIDAHMSAIKALAWCPWRSSILASGGGSNDGRIVLWNTFSGLPVAEQKTSMQTCSLVWSTMYNELVTSHGSPDNDILLWVMKGDQLRHKCTLIYHQNRPLHLALSPDETTLASAGADEILCLWKLFPRKPKEMCSSPVNLFTLR